MPKSKRTLANMRYINKEVIIIETSLRGRIIEIQFNRRDDIMIVVVEDQNGIQEAMNLRELKLIK
jgi:hypothetical protein